MATLGAPALPVQAQTIQLFYNDFSMPLSTPFPNCGPDLSVTPVNTIWQGTGSGTGGGGSWEQVWTVETVLINGPDSVYTDSSGLGGDYCLGMLSAFQDDRVALTLFSDTLPFVNLYMDVSAIDLVACGGPFGTAAPSFHIMVFDSPGGVFNINNPGVPLDEDTVYGGPPASDPYHFAWTQVQVGLDVSGSTDGNVSVMWDLLSSGYAAFDNVLIEASITGVGIPAAAGRKIGPRIHPNPTADVLFIEPFADHASEVSFFTSTGQRVGGVRRYGAGERIQVDVSDWANGAYFLEVRGNGAMQHAWFMVQH